MDNPINRSSTGSDCERDAVSAESIAAELNRLCSREDTREQEVPNSASCMEEGRDGEREASPVELPKRYKRCTSGGSDFTALNQGCIKEEPDCDCSSDSAIDDDSDEEELGREADLRKALRWIMSELITMRKQDKSLMKQFLEIQETIGRFRSGSFSGSISSSLGSFSDYSGSAVSLDERYHLSGGKNRRVSALREEDYLSEFRPRTVSLLTPRTVSNSPRIYRRSFSRECDV